MSLRKKYPQEVDKILAKYPPEQKQSAVMPLLHLAQLEEGFVDRHAMQEIAGITGITETDVAEIIGFWQSCALAWASSLVAPPPTVWSRWRR
jgi:NADH:ubiquinone oxidoreductase subunit E